MDINEPLDPTVPHGDCENGDAQHFKVQAALYIDSQRLEPHFVCST